MKNVKSQFIPISQRIRTFNRAAAHYASAAFVPEEIGTRLLERLDYMRIQPTRVLDLGAGTGLQTRALAKRYPQAHIVAVDIAPTMLRQARQHKGWFSKQHYVSADAQCLPLADHSVDLIFANLLLEWCDDTQAVLLELCRLLKPEGLLMFATLGPDTLQELRASWASVDTQIHVHDFADMHILGDQLVNAKFLDPVIDSEKIILYYPQAHNLLREIKMLGAQNMAAERLTNLGNKIALQQMLVAYEQQREPAHKNYLPVTVEVVYGHAWGPSLSAKNVTNVNGVTYIPIANIQKGNS